MRLLTLKSIVVATDLDEASEPALRTAARLSSLADAKLHVVHVGASTQKSRDQLAQHFSSVVPDAVAPDELHVAAGTPAAAIIEHAYRVAADAIILGPHRKVGSTAELGSTASKVVRLAPCPCLVAARDLKLPLERVIAPIDLSEIADVTLSVALTWASALRLPGGESQLLALHVAPGGRESRADDETLKMHIERTQADASGIARVNITSRVVPGSDATESILNIAKTEDPDLLVMGTRGAARAASGLGSVSAAVARFTPCPLLLVPAAAFD